MVVVSATGGRALGADAAAIKAPTVPSAYDWTGPYSGVHIGYAAGSSKWSASQAGIAGPSLEGSFQFSNPYDLSSGDGSYLLGFQAGYQYMAASRWVIGIETDVSFPNTIGGSQTISSALIGQASYQDRVEFSGTVRGRIGYAPGSWLFYATGGFAYSYDQFTRTQLAGTPLGGTAQLGAAETLFMVPRVGGALSGGVEVALTPSWIARLEYLYTGYASRGEFSPCRATLHVRSFAADVARRARLQIRGRRRVEIQRDVPDAVAARHGQFRGSRPDDICYAICGAVSRALPRSE
jgi:high affinity Mn2+ porin